MSSEPLEQQSENEVAPPPRKPPRRPFVLADLLRAGGLILLAWAFLQVAWFWRSNTALWHRDGAPFGVISGLFTTDWSFSLANSPPLAFMLAMSMVAITTLLGVVIFRALDVFLRPRVQIALGFAIGLGVSGIAFELLTMSRLLYSPLVWLTWLLLFWLFGGLAFWRNRSAVLRWWRKPAGETEGWIPFLDEKRKDVRRCLTVRAPRPEELYPSSAGEIWFWRAGFILIAVMTFAIFWHAVFFPEVYWDSLILYLGYARMTYIEHAFPFKAVAQVGIGLGANYPHLFSTYGAMASTMFGGWSDLYQRVAAPMAGTLAVLLVYDTVLLMWGRRGVAMAAAVLFRAVPLGIAYSTYASDYAIAIYFTAAFLYLTALFARTRLPGVFALLTFVPAAAMHVNYLMGILWVPWAIAVLLAVRAREKKLHEESLSVEEDLLSVPRFFRPETEEEDDTAEPLEMELQAAEAPGLRPVLLSRWFWLTIIVCSLAGSTWYARNYVLTGNPVYAFFPNLFPASVNINSEVLKSADIEWFLNGDGIGRPAEEYVDIEKGISPREQDAEIFQREARLRHRVDASWLYWQGFETFRENKDQSLTRGNWLDRLYWLALVTKPEPPAKSAQQNFAGAPLRFLRWPHVYKMAPLVLGFFLPGLIAGLLIWLFARSALFANIQPYDRCVFETVFWSSFTLVAALIGYHYLLADYYLYQIIPVIVPMSILAASSFVVWRSEASRIEKFLEIFAYILVLAAGIVPGVVMSLMNFKTPGSGVAYGQQYNAVDLDIFRHPGMDPDVYYRLRYSSDVDMWNYLNERALDSRILTHENRHYVFDASITFIHLDDWEIQKTYAMTGDEEKMRLFKELGIDYYLRVDNESKHSINRRVGLDRLIERGFLHFVARDGSNELYKFQYNQD